MKITKAMISGGLIGGMLAAPVSAALFGNRDIIRQLYFAIFPTLEIDVPFSFSFTISYPFYVFFTGIFRARNVPSLITGFLVGLVLGSLLARYVESEQAKPDPFWISTKKKVWGILFMMAATLISTLPYSILSILILPILLFPMGLASWVSGSDASYIATGLIWIVYGVMAAAIFFNKRKRLTIALYVALTIMLIFNVAGCHVIAPDLTSDIH